MGLLEEINEQPFVNARLIRSQADRITEIARLIRSSDIRYIYLAARGSSDNAGKYAQYLFGAVNRLPMALAVPSLFSLYRQPPLLKNAFVIGISQSGMSPDILSVLEEGRRQGCPTLLITNSPHSPMAEAVDHVIDIQVGEEKAVAATKSYTATLTAIAMLSAILAGSSGMLEELERLPRWMKEQLAQADTVTQLADRYREMEKCVILGRGFNYATVFEWSLKMKELAEVMAEPYSAADFLHGPIAIARGKLPIFAVVPRGKTNQSLLDLLKSLHEQRRSDILSISNDENVLALSQVKIKIPLEVPEWLSPIVSILPAQLFSYSLTRAKGLDPDSPAGLTKVTQTK
jgi:glucosamine--fructose-6-phosphate aminotransferase (isomerizing)